MAPHDAMARKNHSQSLERLAERGGLGAAEAELIVTGQPLYPRGEEWDWSKLKQQWFQRAERVNCAYLASHPAADYGPDGEPLPVTEEWLNTEYDLWNACCYQNMKRFEIAGDSIRVLAHACEWPKAWEFSLWIGKEKRWDNPTRPQLRRLIAALKGTDG